jgi:hypothetical protein
MKEGCLELLLVPAACGIVSAISGIRDEIYQTPPNTPTYILGAIGATGFMSLAEPKSFSKSDNEMTYFVICAIAMSSSYVFGRGIGAIIK